MFLLATSTYPLTSYNISILKMMDLLAVLPFSLKRKCMPKSTLLYLGMYPGNIWQVTLQGTSLLRLQSESGLSMTYGITTWMLS